MRNRLGVESLRFYLAFGQSWLNPNQSSAPSTWDDMVWTEITQFVRSGSVTHGRQDPESDFQVGTADIILSNFDGRFDPRVVGGIYADEDGKSLCQIDTPFKIETIPLNFDEDEEATPVVYPVFAGITGGFLTERMIRGDKWVPLQAWTMLKLLNIYPMYCKLPRETTKERVWRILDYIGWPAESLTEPRHRRTYGSDSQTYCQATVLEGAKAGEHILHAIRTEGRNAFCGIQKGGAFAFSYRNTVYEEPWSNVRFTFGNDGVNLPYRKIVWQTDERGFYNQVRVPIVTSEDRSFKIVSVAPDVTSQGSTTLPVEPMGGRVRTGSKIDFGVGRVVKKVTDSAFEDVILIIDNAPADIPAGAAANYDPDVGFDADNDSQILHGKREAPESSILSDLPELAQAMAEDWLQRALNPMPRITQLDLTGIRHDGVSEAIIKIAEGYRCNVIDDPGYTGIGTVEEQSVICQGLTHAFRKRRWDTVIYTDARGEDIPFWIWDDDDPTAAVWDESTWLQL